MMSFRNTYDEIGAQVAPTGDREAVSSNTYLVSVIYYLQCQIGWLLPLLFAI